MITINDYDNRFPKLNEEYFNSLSDEEKQTYLKRLEIYHNALINMIIKSLDLKKLEDSINNSKNEFKPINNDKKDLYQLMSSDKLKYLYLRNNLYIERLSEEELKVLDNNKNEEVYPLVQDTFKNIIDDYPGKNMITNYGPNTDSFYAKSSNLIIGIRVDDDYFPNGSNKLELITNREFELDFLKSFLESKIKKNLDIEGTVIHYTKNSIKLLNSIEEEPTKTNKK